MVSYRCYLINAEDHIVKSWAIETASEDEAVAAAEQLLSDHPAAAVELWLGRLCIHRAEGHPALAASRAA